MDHTDRLAALRHDERRYLGRVKNLERLAGELIRPDGLWALRHYRAHIELQYVPSPDMSAQIAICDNADQPAVALDNADATERLGGHFRDGLGHPGAHRRERKLAAHVHDVAHEF